jgi:ribosomal protein S12 methylthiotransferase accessory factor YcaO
MSQRTKRLKLVDSRLVHRGAEYRLPEWLEIGQSFFLPTLKSDELITKVKARYAARGIQVVHEMRIEADHLGIRVWRVL